MVWNDAGDAGDAESVQCGITYPCPWTTSSSASCLQLLQVPAKMSVAVSQTLVVSIGDCTYHFVGCGVVLRRVVVVRNVKSKWAEKVVRVELTLFQANFGNHVIRRSPRQDLYFPCSKHCL